jgi:O-antigen/teichoic acid export membrane protein
MSDDLASTPEPPGPPGGTGDDPDEESNGRLATMAADLLGRRTRWAAVVELLQLLSSTVAFLVLPSLLDTTDYGIMGGVTAAAVPALNLSNMGSHILLLRRAARGEDLRWAWQRAITLGTIGPGLSVLVLISLHPVLLPQVDWTVYTLLVVGGVVAFWLSELVVYLPIGLGHLRNAAVLRFATFLTRVSALAWFAVYGGAELVNWAWANLIGFAAAGLLGLVIIHRMYGVAPGFRRDAVADVRPGLPFSVNGASENLVDGADRFLLLRFDHNYDAGIYTLGGRAIHFAFVPIRMLLRAHDSELYAAGKHGVRSALQISIRLAPSGVLLGFGAAVTFWLVAPVVPWILGQKWQDAPDVIRLLSFLPALRSMQYMVGNTLSASDRQWSRFGATLFTAVLNLVLNLIFLPNGGWRTAVATTLVSELALLVFLCLLVWYWAMREDIGDPVSGETGIGTFQG